ncbi:MAG: hypothetical protein ABJY16_12415, partial [Parvibaculum sp.]
IQEAWATSDSARSFSHALEERGLYLARGDSRGHVAVTFEGGVVSISRATGRKSKELQARLGKPDDLRSVEEARKRVAEDILPRVKTHMDQARAKSRAELAELDARRAAMAKSHADERTRLDAGQKARSEAEARMRAERFRKGVAGVWDRLTGKRAQREKQNEFEALWALRRDQDQRQMTVDAQLRERGGLQDEIKSTRARHAQALRALHFDAANYRLMERGQEPKAKAAFERLAAPRVKEAKGPERPRLDQPQERKAERPSRAPSTEDRLRRLRERKRKGPSRDGPDLER